MKRALITGISGQDGSYLADLLLSKGYEVFGLARAGSSTKNVPEGVNVLTGDLEDHNSLKVAVIKSRPDEVYNLGGITDLKTAYESPERTRAVNYCAVGMLLEAALKVNKNVRFLQASSSEIFLPSAEPLKEDSPRDWETKNPYAWAKMMADRDFIQTQRKNNGVFCCSAILFSHESPRRSEKSVIRKITRTLVKIKLGLAAELSVGNIELKRDWGFAGDYVLAMWRMLQSGEPEDFVVATGQVHRVREVIDQAADWLDLDPKLVIKIAPEFYRPSEPHPKVGDIRRAEQILHWKPKVSFEALIEMMVKTDLAELTNKSDKTFLRR